MTAVPKTLLRTIVAVVALLPLAAGAADTSMTQMMSQIATIPCSQADGAMAQMMSTATSPDVMKTSGNVDADYTRTMQIMSGTGLAMSKLEARCGTTAAARKKAAQASKMLEPFFTGFSGTDIRGSGY